VAERAVSLRVFPTDDHAFRDDAEAAMRGATSPVALQRTLRTRFPAAIVRAREDIADPGFGPDVWYVFRYGSARPVERWWTGGDHPWAILDDRRRFVDVSPALAAIVEAPAEAIVGHLVEEFANPEDPTAMADVEALWAQFLVAGSLDATMRFRRLDGTEREIEYHLVANSAGRGRHRAIVRELIHDPDAARDVPATVGTGSTTGDDGPDLPTADG
jgi:PAS domain-containing protein